MHLPKSLRRQRASKSGDARLGANSIHLTAESAALQRKLAAAIQHLDDCGSTRHLYQLPWYMVVGPPGAGKTTALMKAGLDFVSRHAGVPALIGVNSTAQPYEWWFTREAVLIDTVDQHTFRDSETAGKSSGWYALLALLAQLGRARPLHGIIVIMPVSDFSSPGANVLPNRANSIRDRLNDLETRLGQTVPVYVLLTKMDLIPGFDMFFGNLDERECLDSWGVPFGLQTGPDLALPVFEAGFRTFIGRLETQMFRRLQDERSVQRRTRIAMFPGHIMELEQPLWRFLTAISADNHLWLRGVWFTSAAQEGIPHDRPDDATKVLNLDASRTDVGSRIPGRTYFLQGFFRNAVFPEAKLVEASPATARRKAALRATALGASVIGLGLSLAYLWHVRSETFRAVTAAANALQVYRLSASALDLGHVENGDLKGFVPLLDVARAASNKVPPESWLGPGQHLKLNEGMHALYRHALERVMLPRLLFRLENQMRDNERRPDFLYEATRIYLMLGNAGPMDKNSVREWMRHDWQALYPRDETVRIALLHHLDALLSEQLSTMALDNGLVTRSREAVSRIPPAQRAYSRIRLSSAAQQLQPWRPSDSLGPVGVALFTRSSGKPLTDGISGFYTVKGFHTVVLPLLETAARQIVAESWVTRGVGAQAIDPAQLQALERNIVHLYEVDYARAWDAILADLDVAPLSSVSRAAQDLYILASPQSPMRTLLVSMVSQLTLAGPLQSRGMALSQIGSEIDNRYRALRELVGNGPGAPIDQVLRSLNDLQQQFAKAAAASAGIAVLANQADPSVALRAEALRQPEPLARWLTALATSAAALRSGAKP